MVQPAKEPRDPPGDRGNNPNGPKKPRKPPTKNPPPSPLATTTSLITSTGGLFGSGNFLLTPYYDIKSNKYRIAICDVGNFNSEEDCVYNFRMEDVAVAREVTIHKVIIVYRDLGKVKFSVDLQAYSRRDDTYINAETFKASVGDTSPDNLLHTLECDITITGERPQLIITKLANAGPLSIISATIAGTRDQENLL